MDNIELAYIAGLFDGEGCIGIHRQKYLSRKDRKKPYKKGHSNHPNSTYRSIITIANTDKEIIEYIQSCFNGSTHQVIVHKGNPKWKDSYEWRASTKTAADIIKLLLPYLRIKRRRAEILLKYQEFKDSLAKRGKRNYSKEEWAILDQFYARIHNLNRHPGDLAIKV